MKPILLALLIAAAPAQAREGITVEAPFAYATPPGAPVAGGYMTLVNDAGRDDVLLSVAVAPEVAGRVELHEMAMDGEVMRMRPVEEGIPVPAGETVTLEPGGLHVMFMQLPDGFEPGEEIAATLTFREAGEVEIVLPVVARGSEPASGRHGMQGSGGGH